MSWLYGLDLGQVSDYSAFVAIEQTRVTKSNVYAIRHLERFTLGTPYPSVVEWTRHHLAQAKRKDAYLCVDQTGVGRAVVDLFRQAQLPAHLWPITITSGTSLSHDGTSSHVPKRELVSVLQALMQTRRLTISRQLPLAEQWKDEMQQFRVKISRSANETFGAGKSHQHDDLVLATALAVWVGENKRQPHDGSLICSTTGEILLRTPKTAIEEIIERIEFEEAAEDAWRAHWRR